MQHSRENHHHDMRQEETEFVREKEIEMCKRRMRWRERKRRD